MKNFAGIGAGEADVVVGRELAEAGIRVVPHTPVGEVRAALGGVIEADGYEIRLRRAWVYWVASVERMPNCPEDAAPHLPGPLAVALNDAPHARDFGSKYSGDLARLGGVVRADGYAGGQPSSALLDGVRGWHIDTQEGLNAFAAWCRSSLAGGPVAREEPGTRPRATQTPSCASEAARALPGATWRAAMLTECCKVPARVLTYASAYINPHWE